MIELLVSTPLERVLDARNVRLVEAEDATGRFGILPGHADFLTVLAVSVLSWRDDEGTHHLAVRGGVLRVTDGRRVEIATRQAVGEETLEALGERVLETLKAEVEEEAEARTLMAHLELSLVRNLREYLEMTAGALPVHRRRTSGAREDPESPDERSAS